MLADEIIDRSDAPGLILRKLSPHVLSELIQAILTDVRELSRICARSFLHSTGIFKLVLSESTYSSSEVRLHVWKSGCVFPSGSNYESVHNHRWHFCSRILQGTFCKELFVVSNAGPGSFSHYRFEATAPGQLNTVTERGSCDLQTSFRVHLFPGQTYEMAPSAYHLIKPVDENFSATLFVRGPYETNGTDVFLPAEMSLHEASSKSIEPIEPNQVKNLLQVIQRD
ncbi:hypothetical protein [Oceanococcus atlanticus]|uniref:hypothetical protein n=1 Tax=Oceanococcus atlanticus TaxID=1317117 RepID=UPI00198241C5|nr:hypothetical protein [Oceanococcus atlanticus]